MNNMMLNVPEIYESTIHTCIKKTKKKISQTFIAGAFAGAFIALGGFGAAMGSHAIENFSLAKLAAGLIFPVGLMLVLLCGAELFTGNSLLIIPLVEKKITISSLLKNWTIVYLSNFVGAFIIVLLIFYSGLLGSNHDALGGYAIKIAAYKCNLSFTNALASGILCNFIVTLTVWASYAAKDVVSKIAVVWFPIMTFVVCGFEHSVANMYYLFVGLLAKGNLAYVNASHVSQAGINSINMTSIIKNLIPVTIGNIIGGAVFVGLAFWVMLKYNYPKSSLVIDTDNFSK